MLRNVRTVVQLSSLSHNAKSAVYSSITVLRYNMSDQSAADPRQWIYLDDNNIEQGPFTTQKLRNWYNKHVLRDTLLIKCVSPVQYKTEFDVLHRLLLTPLTSTNDTAQQSTTEADDNIVDNDVNQVTVNNSANWYYIGDDDRIHGPYASELMLQWHTAGYLKPTIKLRTEQQTEYTQLSELPNNVFEVTDSELKTLLTKAGVDTMPQLEPINDNNTELHTDTNDASDNDDYVVVDYNDTIEQTIEQLQDKNPHHYYYIDSDNIIRGPYHTTQMRYWYSQGWFTVNNVPIRHTSEIRFLKLTERRTLPAFTVACENRWYYIDTAGIQQGPFTADMMSTWYHNQYFQSTLPIKQVGEVAYSKLGDVQRSFMTPLPPPAIATQQPTHTPQTQQPTNGHTDYTVTAVRGRGGHMYNAATHHTPHIPVQHDQLRHYMDVQQYHEQRNATR